MSKLGIVLGDFWRFICFQPLRGDIRKDWFAYLAIGVATTWLVGFGRTWDFHVAPWWFRTGFTSIVYALVLSLFIWGMVHPLKPERWSYRNVLLMVMMTALPGLIYAIPVERFVSIQTAQLLNLAFLVVVAGWRMALYRHFLQTVAKLPPYETLVAWLLPPGIIIAVISLFGFLDAVLRGMSGDRADNPNELATDVFLFIGLITWIALPFLLLAYVVLAIRRQRDARPPTQSALD